MWAKTDRIPRSEEWHERLRESGLRVTAPRLSVIAALTEYGNHQDAESLITVARASLGTLSTQAVYNNLHALTAAGLVRRIELPGQPARYELRTGDNHHHIVCRRCGTTRDVDCVTGAAPCLTPSESHGFVVDEAEVTFWGTCPQCQEKEIETG